jgi:hypothetical protein
MRTKKPCPALKHAGYSTTTLLPGENRSEFEKLHRAVVAEMRPVGALEDELVLEIARLLWRKRNLKTFRKAELVGQYISEVRSEFITSEEAAEELAEYTCQVETRDQAVEQRGRRELGKGYELAEMGEAVTIDRLIRDLDVIDRLNASIQRCLKQLVLLRGVKSLPIFSSSVPSERLSPPTEA